MARVIAFVNQKGGVGKTTMSINFGCGIKKIFPDKKVLFIDMDSQCSMTYLLGVVNYQFDAFDMITKQCWIEDAIYHTPIYDIVPASRKLASLENIIVGSKRETSLRRSINYIKDQYDYIIIDCQPTLSFLTVNCLTAADDVIIPALPDVFSIQGINQLSDTIETIKSRGENDTLRIAGIAVNMYDGRYIFNREAMDVLKQIASELGTKVFNTTIRTSVCVREAQANRVSIFQYTKAAKQITDFENLVKEYMKDIKVKLPTKKSKKKSSAKKKATAAKKPTTAAKKKATAEKAAKKPATAAKKPAAATKKPTTSIKKTTAKKVDATTKKDIAKKETTNNSARIPQVVIEDAEKKDSK